MYRLLYISCPSLLSLLKRLGTLRTSHCSERGTKRCWSSWCTLDILDEDTISLSFIFVLLFFSLILALIFPSLDRWVRRMERKRIWPFFEGYQSRCWTCYCLCNVWHVAAWWFLGTVQTIAYVPSERLGLQQTPTTSGTSQVEISHIWEPQTSVELPLNSSGQNSCAVGENTSRKIRHMVGFPLTSRALLAKVLESMLVEHRNILRW